jgi:hypothetical protein
MLDNKEINARIREELFGNFELEESILDELLKCKTPAEYAEFKTRYSADVVRELCATKITSSHITIDHFYNLKSIPAPTMFL